MKCNERSRFGMKVIDIGEDTTKTFATYDPFSSILHVPVVLSCTRLPYTHPITKGLPSLDLVSLDTLQHDTAPWCQYCMCLADLAMIVDKLPENIYLLHLVAGRESRGSLLSSQKM